MHGLSETRPYWNDLNKPKKIASQISPLIRKNKKPATPNRRKPSFQFFFSMFRCNFDGLGKVKCFIADKLNIFARWTQSLLKPPVFMMKI